MVCYCNQANGDHAVNCSLRPAAITSNVLTQEPMTPEQAYAKGREDERAERLAVMCMCGHARAAHEGHTCQPGYPEPTYCSQLCGCGAFRYVHALVLA